MIICAALVEPHGAGCGGGSEIAGRDDVCGGGADGGAEVVVVIVAGCVAGLGGWRGGGRRGSSWNGRARIATAGAGGRAAAAA